ncbi:MAG TPA: hypothetical protein PKW56_03565 [Clostridiales bacterium]|nr:hypothetical protein [Clostridiales bacterium]
MDIQMLKEFFMWCSIISVSVMVFWTLVFMAIPDLVYKSQKWVFPKMTRDNFDLIIYCYIGIFKIFFIVFNLIPFLVLLIIT